MKRSPLLLTRIAPSPRQPSVSRTPAPATPVGGNCQNSMSCSGTPARAPMPRPASGLLKAVVGGAGGGGAGPRAVGGVEEVCVAAAEEAARPAGGQQHGLGLQDMQFAA